MKANKLIGLNIARHREAQDMKQLTLAKKIGIEPSALSQIETGKTDTTVNRLEQIAQALNIDFVTLVSSPNAINIHNSPNSGNNIYSPNSTNNDLQLTRTVVATMEKMAALMEKLSHKF